MTDSTEIRLVKIDTGNFRDIVMLEVKEEQKNFVAHNAYSLAEAYANLARGRFVQPFGIYAGDVPVGFLMIGYFRKEDARPEEREEGVETMDFEYGNYLFWRFMIDTEHQGRGYGRKAMQLALDYIRTNPAGPAEYCWLSYEPENEAAKELYRSFGFVEYERLPQGWDEIPALLKL
jgi:diamine N-acetyltransferase